MRTIRTAPPTLVLAVILAVAVPAPSYAQAPSSASAMTGVGSPLGGKRASERVERYITDLHDRLAINPAQQLEWNAFAAVMRENAVAQEAAYNKREARGTVLSAIDDLKAYAAMERSRAADVDRLLAPFETLYNAMDAEQRTQADRTFQEVQRRGPRGKG